MLGAIAEQIGNEQQLNRSYVSSDLKKSSVKVRYGRMGTIVAVKMTLTAWNVVMNASAIATKICGYVVYSFYLE